MKIELIKPNLPAKARRAMIEGRTDNLEVLAYLVEHGLIDGAYRSCGSERVEYDLEELQVALKREIEVR